MKKKSSPKARVKKAKVYMDCSQEQAFWLCTGNYLYNLNQLVSALEGIDEGAFRYHVNEEKNDFSNWIRDVFGEKTLAKKLSTVKDKKKFLSIVKSWVKK